MTEDKDIWVTYENRIDALIYSQKISLNEVRELFEIGHAYNMQRKLIPETLSDWMKNQADKYRSKSKALYKTLGIDLPTTRPTDGYTMAMVVSNVWEGIFSEKPIEDIFSSIGKKGGRPRLQTLDEIKQQLASSNNNNKKGEDSFSELPKSLSELKKLWKQKQRSGH